MSKYPWQDKQDRRREERRPIPVKNTQTIKPLTKERSAQNRLYLKLRAQFLRDHPICQVNIECIKAPATEIHHKKGRIGNLLTDVRYFLACCRACHDWELKHSKEAKEKGISESRLN